MIFAETNVHPRVSDAELKRFLRFPPQRALEGPLAENAAWARDWFAVHAQPWYCALPVEARTVPGRGLVINGELFGTPELVERLGRVEDAVIAIASAGVEAENEATVRWKSDEPDRSYFLDCYAASVADALVREARRRLETSDVKNFDSIQHGPGYPGWSIAETPRLLAGLQRDRTLPGPLEALPSGMLRPKKSHLVLLTMRSLGPSKLRPANKSLKTERDRQGKAPRYISAARTNRSNVRLFEHNNRHVGRDDRVKRMVSEGSKFSRLRYLSLLYSFLGLPQCPYAEYPLTIAFPLATR